MTFDEFTVYVMAIKTAYPKEKFLETEQQMETWYRFLKDIPYDVATAGFSKWVITEKWTPTIADIRKMASDCTLTPRISDTKAWDNVLRVIRYYGYYREDEALNELDDISARIVKHLGFKNLCMTEEKDLHYERERFKEMYANAVDQERHDALLPEKLKDLIQKMQIGAIEKHG